MADVFMEFEATVRDESGREYIPAWACGRECLDGHWEGLAGVCAARWRRGRSVGARDDATQSCRYRILGDRTDSDLPGGRARRALAPVEVVERVLDLRPAYDEPAQPRRIVSVSGARLPRARPVLNPFQVYEQGEDILRGQLAALDAPRLRDLIRGYSLSPGDTGELMRVSEAELADRIIMGVRTRMEPEAGASRAARRATLDSTVSREG